MAGKGFVISVASNLKLSKEESVGKAPCTIKFTPVLVQNNEGGGFIGQSTGLHPATLLDEYSLGNDIYMLVLAGMG